MQDKRQGSEVGTFNLNATSNSMQKKVLKFLEIGLISFTFACCIVLYTVGLDQTHLGYERRWTYPLFFALIPAFCLRACLRYLLDKKTRGDRDM